MADNAMGWSEARQERKRKAKRIEFKMIVLAGFLAILCAIVLMTVVSGFLGFFLGAMMCVAGIDSLVKAYIKGPPSR